MMTHYVDIRLRPDPEFPANQLLNALFSKLHRALVQLQSDDVGVSFPEFQAKRSLGECLRLHGSCERLDSLMALSWLQGMRDHVDLGEILAAPADCQYRVVRRVQAQSSPERLRRRYIKRHGVTVEDAVNRLPDSIAKELDLPFVYLRSQSTGQQFRLFVEHGDLINQPLTGNFSCYGLSAVATVPWF